MRFPAQPKVARAHQWWKDGDWPGEDPTSDERVVRRADPDPNLDPACGQAWGVHGWLDTGEDSVFVCPGDWIAEYGNFRKRVYHPGMLDTQWVPLGKNLIAASVATDLGVVTEEIKVTFAANCRDCAQRIDATDYQARSDWVGAHRVKTGHIVDSYEVEIG